VEPHPLRRVRPVYDWVAKPFEAGRSRAIERVDPQPEDRILILGCGTGMDLEQLPAGASVTAIDVSGPMVRRAESRAESLGIEIDARVGDAQSLPFDDSTFDVVLLHLVVSLVPDPKALVDEAARVQRAKLRFVVQGKEVAGRWF